MLKKIVTTAIMAAVCSVNLLSAAETVVLTSTEWEPYVGEKLAGNGFVGEIVKESFKRSGYDVKFQFYPWARTVQMSDNGDADGYFPEYYAKERESAAIFSEPFGTSPVGFFKKKGAKISYQKLEDLKSYKIGVVRDYQNEEKFDAAAYLKKEEATDDATNIRKLFADRIDLFVADKFVGLHVVKTAAPGKQGELEFVDPPLIEQKLFVCISKKAKNGTAKLKAFNEGLAKIKADGTYEKILTKYGFGKK